MMETELLIRALSADGGRRRPPLARIWAAALALAVAAAAAVFLSTLGVRPDFAQVIHTVRFPFKFVVTLALAVTAGPLLFALSRPGAPARAMPLLAAPALLAVAAATELTVSDPAQWSRLLVGTNSLLCLTFIPMIGLAPLAIFLLALRLAAPTRPALAGAAAGLLAGGLAATFYAAHCTDDSPLFVMTWYSLAVAALCAVGALAAPKIARW